MRMFRKEKFPQENGGVNVHTAEDEAMINRVGDEGSRGMVAENDNSVSQYGNGPKGAARVLIAARTLFPCLPDEAALDFLMDVFEEKMRQPAENENKSVMLASLYEDEKRLKKIIPDFSVSKAFENEEFKRLVLDEGKDLFTAYEMLNPSLGKEQNGIIDEVGNTAYASVPGSSTSDITTASDEEFKKYIKSILEEE